MTSDKAASKPAVSMPEDPWFVRNWDFPGEGAPREQLMFLLNYAVLAPSGHNTQPWWFEIDGGTVAIHADRTRALPVVDPGDRELVMSCGAALFHLRVAMRHFGLEPVVHLFPDPDDQDLLARVEIGASYEPTMEDNRLFMAIKKRHTNRRAFEDRPVPARELERITTAARTEGAQLHVFTEPEGKHALADLIAEGDRIQGRDGRFRRELAMWVHPNRSRSRDGIPGYAQGVGDLLSYIGPLWIRTFDWGGEQAAKDRQLAEGSPVLLVLATEADDVRAHLRAGQALDRVLLTACTYDLDASYLNQPIEVSELRPKLAALIGGGHPQLVLRMGYGPPVQTTPRRPVAEVLSSVKSS